MEATAQEESPSIVVDDQSYEIESLSDKTKELLSLHQEAQQKMLEARRKAVIAEVAVSGLVQMISAAVKEEEQPENAVDQ